MPLYAATVFLSAFLLFLVQPILAKQILPWFGGSAGVWTTCLVFFQSVDRTQIGQVLIITREVKEHIRRRAQSQPL